MSILAFLDRTEPTPKEAPEHLQLSREEIDQYRFEDMHAIVMLDLHESAQAQKITNPYYNPPEPEEEKPRQIPPSPIKQKPVKALEQAENQSYRWYRTLT